MIFASQIFLFWFLPLVVASYYVTPTRHRSLHLVIASYVFYGWWRIDFSLLMMVSTIVDYVCGGSIARLGDRLTATDDPSEQERLRRQRKKFLVTSIVVNLGFLAYFKYANFGIESMNTILAHFGIETVHWTKVILPIGISFYTFQTMSYSIDVYRGDAPPVNRFIDFACYVVLFPQLVAGPIVRYRSLADQLATRSHTLRKLSDGAFLFQIGFVKKVLIADSIAGVVDRAYGLTDPTASEAWLGTIAYAFQIYFDFSGYSDMAIGLGLMFGFVFPINFDSPYKSQSITEFWRRWHISLSSWLRDYLYIPLGGNKSGPKRTYVNLMLTMVLGGLWHGAAWTFLLWGAYQGGWLAFERWLGKRSLYSRLALPFRIGLTFIIALGGWVFFRATDVEQAFQFLRSMLFIDTSVAFPRYEVRRLEQITLVAASLIVWFAPNSNRLVADRGWLVTLTFGVLFPLAVLHLFFVSYSPFLYFQF